MYWDRRIAVKIWDAKTGELLATVSLTNLNYRLQSFGNAASGCRAELVFGGCDCPMSEVVVADST